MSAGTPAPPPTAERSVKSIAGRNRFRKQVDSGPNGPCFDLEQPVRYIYVDDNGDGGVQAQPVFIVDPCQANSSPLKTATILPGEVALSSPIATANLGVFLNEGNETPSTTVSLSNQSIVLQRRLMNSSVVATSPANTAQVFVFDCRNLAKTLAIIMTASAGTATVTVEVSTDNTSFTTVDSIAAAAATVKQYVEATVGAITAVSPLAFRIIRITIGAAGVGNTTTVTISMK